MKDTKKLWEKLRKAEGELIYANPSRAAKLATKIVKWKAEVFRSTGNHS